MHDNGPPFGDRSLGERLIRGGAWAFGMRLAGGLAYLAATSIVARVLAPDQAGVYFLGASLVTALGTVGEFGLGRATSRLVAERLGLGRAGETAGITRVAIRVGALTALGTATLYAVFGNWAALSVFHNPALATLTPLVVAWIFFLSVQRILGETFRGFHRIGLATMFGYTTDGLAPSVFFIVLLALIWRLRAYSLWNVTLVAMMAVGLSACLAIGLLVRQRRAGVTEGPRPATPAIGSRALLAIGAPILATGLTNLVLNNQFDLAILGHFRGGSDLALYGSALKLTLFVTAPLMVANAVLPPFIAELHATNQHAKLQWTLRTSAFVTGLPSLLALAIVSFWGRPILATIFGAYYAAAGPILLLLALSQMVNVFGGSCGLVLLMTGHEVEMMKISVMVAVISVTVGVFAAMEYGAMGLAAAAILRELLGNALRVAVVRRKLGLWTPMPLWLGRYP